MKMFGVHAVYIKKKIGWQIRKNMWSMRDRCNVLIYTKTYEITVDWKSYLGERGLQTNFVILWMYLLRYLILKAKTE